MKIATKLPKRNNHNNKPNPITMLKDPNVERYVAEAIKPLQKQIEELKTEITNLRQVVNKKKDKGWDELPWISND